VCGTLVSIELFSEESLQRLSILILACHNLQVLVDHIVLPEFLEDQQVNATDNSHILDLGCADPRVVCYGHHYFFSLLVAAPWTRNDNHGGRPRCALPFGSSATRNDVCIHNHASTAASRLAFRTGVAWEHLGASDFLDSLYSVRRPS
jgi:hypothetical protein